LLDGYWRLLERWNSRINLTALPLAGYPERSVDRILVEPLAAGCLFPDHPVTWVDLGSGGGTPAIPMKVLVPSHRLLMVESRSRKVAFLREVVRSLGLVDTSVESARFESLADRHRGTAEFVTVRAVRPDEALARSALWLLKPPGRLVVFGAGLDLDLPGFRRAASTPAPTSSAIGVYVPRGTS
jgi:16S rRNA (guanine527-N7)-methyltransferase